MKLTTKGATRVPTPHSSEWAALDSDVVLVALRSLVEGMLALSRGERSAAVEEALLTNYVNARRAVDAIAVEIAELDLILAAIKGRIFDGQNN